MKRFFSKILNLPLSTKLIGMGIVTGILSVAIVGLFGYTTARSSLEEKTFNQLKAVNSLKAEKIQELFTHIRGQITTSSYNPTVVQAMKDFSAAFKNYPKAASGKVKQSVRNYYKKEFISRLSESGDTRQAKDFLPESGRTLNLQARYISDNKNEVGEKDKLVKAADGTKYATAHARYHKYFRKFLQQFGYYDIFLADPQTGHIVYSVFKEVDYATSLKTGPYKKAGIGRVYAKANKAQKKDYVFMSDFAPYSPSYNAQASFIASPIFDGNKKVGVLIFQMPIGRINDIMTSYQKWEDVGLGKSGETYIVGADFTLRSQSRFLIEAPDDYKAALEKAQLKEETITKIMQLKSAIGLHPVKTEASTAALAGKSNTRIIRDYRNVDVLSSFAPLPIADVKWAIISEMDVDEAFAAAYSLRTALAIIALGTVVLTALSSFFFARTISRQLGAYMATIKAIATGDLKRRVDIKAEDEIGKLGASFNSMTDNMHKMVGDISKSSDSVQESSDVLTTSSKSLASRNSQVSTQSETIAAATEEMNQSLQMVASSIEEMSISIAEVAQKSSATADLAGGAKELADETDDVVNVLGNKAKEIESVIDTINQIAEQTKLLALNASIEAAGAGEAGAGFAVVAAEVKELARQSGDSLQGIKERIKDIQGSTQGAIEIIKKISEAVGEIAKASSSIAAAVEQQATAAKEISKNVVESSNAAEDVSRNITDISQAARESAQDADTTSKLATNLQQLAEGLRQSVGQFSV